MRGEHGELKAIACTCLSNTQFALELLESCHEMTPHSAEALAGSSASTIENAVPRMLRRNTPPLGA